jgi:hypothetical protein
LEFVGAFAVVVVGVVPAGDVVAGDEFDEG